MPPREVVCHSVGGQGIAGGEEPTRPWMLRTRVDGVARRWREGELAPTRSGYTSLAEERFRSWLANLSKGRYLRVTPLQQLHTPIPP
jgi:hypothetical protein